MAACYDNAPLRSFDILAPYKLAYYYYYYNDVNDVTAPHA